MPARTRARPCGEQRLLDILNSGPLSIKTTAREEDRFGRKLRIVYRDRRSVGDILVAESLTGSG